MLKAERHNFIKNCIEKNGRIVVEDIARELDISPMTIRRDLKYLEETEFVERTHGGAVLKSSLIKEVPYHQKATEHIEEKIRIAEHASKLVKDGLTIILDSGTTNMEIAKRITDRKNVRVIAADLMIALYLNNHSALEIYCTGGKVQSDTGSCLGSWTNGFINDICVDIAFIGSSSIDIEKGLTSPNEEKAKLKRLMIEHADMAVLVADHYKYGIRSFAKICDIDELDMVVTDSGMDPAAINEIGLKDVELVVV